MSTLSPYAQRALNDELDRVRSAVPGEIKMTVYRAAHALGQLVGAGLLDQESVHDFLLETAQHAGLSEQEAREHVGRGLRKGIAKPRDLPANLRDGVGANLVRAPRTPLTSRTYMSPDQARVFWCACVPVTQDDEVAAYLANQREIEPDAVVLWDLARAMPRTHRGPWARSKAGAWANSGHRLVLPMWDARGHLRGFRARCIVPGEAPKALAPAGFTTTGLLFACPLVQQVLASACQPEWWGTRPFALRIVEGGPDFLVMVARASEGDEYGPGVMGVISGSWTKGVAGRIPDGTGVLLAGHDDAAGREQMLRIGSDLRLRCAVSVFRGEVA